ncbi:MAG: chorismate mutase family protein [Micavibrio sp.]|nr:MAG: chorismate mutase family protein [Micavibrio sp.]
MGKTDAAVKEILAPYRVEIDTIDRELVALLVRRFKIVQQVANVKAQHNIPSLLPDRVDEVRENAAKMAEEQGLDGDFVRRLYTLMIDYACSFEDELMDGKNL